MGRWNYFVVKMTMRELAESVKFAADIHDDRTLNTAIQRALDESRVKRSIVTYLVRQQDRFFSSLVIAALDGNPKWYPISIEDSERLALFRDDEKLNDTFGVLAFDGSQNYYALDGQHRLAAIKALVDRNSDAAADAPKNFNNEEISVIVVVPDEAESRDEFMKRYRRLFGNLNRYARAMDNVTNIIMDEDDVFAIITRQIITEHDFFKAPGKQKESVRIKTGKGKQLKSTDSYFTSLETLYEINIRLLTTNSRENNGWDVNRSNTNSIKRFRPDDDLVESLYRELVLYWDALLQEIPFLKNNPTEMRNHASATDADAKDNVLFWPIGQELMADVARGLLNQRQSHPDSPNPESIAKALFGLGKLEWNFHSVPWRHLLLIPKNDDLTDWTIRSEERKPASIIAKRIIMWQIGLDELAEEEILDLRTDWKALLLPALLSEEIDELWSVIEDGVMR